MKQCPYCGTSNYDNASECRKCQASLSPQPGRLYTKPLWVGPGRAKALRSNALAAIVFGLLIKVYFGGYGHWPVIDNPTLTHFRTWLEPALIYGGTVLYLVGWALRWV